MRKARMLAAMLFLCISSATAQTASSIKEDAGKIELTAKDIKEMNASNIVELLNRVPGVEAGDSSVKIRGSLEVKVFMDGRPLNDPLSRHSSIKWSMVSINNVEKIEIFKGSGAVAFGDGTSGGAIRITSKKTEKSHAKLKAQGGNWSTQQYNLDYGRQFGHWGVFASSEYFSTDSYRVNQDKERKRFGVKTDYHPQQDSLYSLSADYAEEERGSAGYPAYPTPHAREYSRSFAPALGITLGRFRNNLNGGIYRQKSTDSDRGIDSWVDGWSLWEDASYSIITDGILNNLALGFTFKADHVDGATIAPRTEASYGVSFQKQFSFGKKGLNATLGFRTNMYSAFDTALNPELRIAYKATPSLDLQFSVTRTNNIPSILRRYYRTSSTRPNPDLDMEKATNLSFFAAYRPNEKLQAGFTVFHNEITDKITYVRDLVGSGGTYRNFGKVTRKGTDLTVEWKPVQWLIIKPSHEYLIAQDEETGLELTASPHHRTQVSIHYKPVRQFTAVLIYERESKQYTRSDNLEYADPYNLFELRADYSIGRWLLYGRIKNLANRTYLYGDGLPAPPRSWIGGLSLEL